MPLSDALRHALVTQVCCGQPDLCEDLALEVDFIWECQNECNDRIRYVYTQLALIEYAQIRVRLQIDTSTRNLAHTTTEDYTLTGKRNTDGESTATGRSCNWAAATSQQYFNRDSTDDMVSFSERNMQRTAERIETGYDKSCRHTVGHAFTLSHVEHTVDDKGGEANGAGLGTEISRANRVSSTDGGTGPFIPLQGLTYDPAPEFSLTPPFLTVVGPGPLLPETLPASGQSICPEPDPNDEDEEIPCQRPSYASYGQTYQGRFSITIGAPGIGALKVEWGDGKSYRQYYHCTLSSVRGTAVTSGRNERVANVDTEALPSQNRSRSDETTNVYHLVRKYDSSTRRGIDTTDAEERQYGYADGVSHSESKRDSKGQAYQQRRAESLTTGHTESHLRREEHLTDDEVRRSYGQISEQLAKMWKRAWDNVLILQRQFIAVPFGGSMSCNTNTRIGCACPQRRSYLEICNVNQVSGSCSAGSMQRGSHH